jgi:hypothetical protein
MAITPQFHTTYDWTTGSTWIADGGQKIARVESPRLRDVVMRPGGGPLATWLTLFWWQYADNEKPGRSAWILDELRLDDRDPACYRLKLETHNADRSITSHCQLNLTYAAEIDSYVYEISTEMEVLPGKEWLVEPQGGIEYADPWFKDAVGSAVPFPGAETPRWSWVVYTDSQGQIVRLPLNHLGVPLLERIRFPASGGWMGFFNHPDGNPVIEMDAETAQATRAEVCAWGYDVHLIQRIPTEIGWDANSLDEGRPFKSISLKSGQKLSARYRFYFLPATAGRRLLEHSIQPELPEKLVEQLTRPAYRAGNNTFQDGIFPSNPDCSWYWSPSHPEGVTWERAFGRLDQASLAIQNQIPRLAFWEVPQGSDFWMNPLPSSRQRLGAWIKTDGVSGKGAYLSFRFSNYLIATGQIPPLTETVSEPITGNMDWTYIELMIDTPPQGASRGYLRLVLEGVGTAWFDDVCLETVN